MIYLASAPGIVKLKCWVMHKVSMLRDSRLSLRRRWGPDKAAMLMFVDKVLPPLHEFANIADTLGKFLKESSCEVGLQNRVHKTFSATK